MRFDRDRLTIRKLDERISKTSYNPMNRIPDIKQQDQLTFVNKLTDEIKEKKKVIIGFGGHFIKNKCHRHLIDLMTHNYITHVVTNGASTIHDFEFGYHGKTEEDVKENLANGTFGLWETGEHINKAINLYAYLGYGKAMGKYIDIERDRSSIWPGSCVSLAWHCYKRDIPLSVCTSIGHDIIYEHPKCDGAKIGQASYIDFLNLAHTMEGIQDAVFICVGSAITFPMVMEKAYAMAKNVEPTTGNNCSCYIVDLFDVSSGWNEGEPDKSDPAYYNRPMKTFSRMVSDCHYMKLDNRQLMYHLRESLDERS
jgi:hypothetical protein